MSAYADQWYRADRPHEALASWAEKIENRQGGRATQLLYALRLYGDRELAGYAPHNYALENRAAGVGGPTRLSLNIVRSCVDSAVSMACENQPRVEWLTSGADWTLQKKAKARTKFTDGLFYKGKVVRARRKAIKDACLMGSGLVKVLERHGEVHYETTFPGNLHVDEQEAYHGDPRNLLEVRPYDREVLMSLFPKAAKKIKTVDAASSKYFGRDPSADQVLVREAWHLPSTPDAKDGRHVIAIETETLRDEKWTAPRFPFGHWRWSEEPLGFWGVGLAHQLMGIQLEINMLLETIQENIYRGGNLKVFVERAANVVQAHLSNTLNVPIIEYSGAPPTFAVTDVVSPQILQHLDTLKRDAYEITGISAMSAKAEMPASVSSGRQAAIYANLHSKRFITFGQADEEAMTDVAVVSMECAKRIAEEEGSYKIYRQEKNWLEEIDIKAALDDEDAFQPEAATSAMASRSVTGRMAIAEAMEDRGWWTSEQSKKFINLSKDLDAEMTLQTSPSDLVDEYIERILEEGEALMANPRMHLVAARERAQLAFNRAFLRNVPAHHIDLLGRFLDSIDDIEKKEAEKAAAAAAAAMPPTDLGAMPPAIPPGPAGMAPPIPPAPQAPGPPPILQ